MRSPKVYVRDSGIVHALLGLGDREAVLSHPVAGASWEGHIIENVLSCMSDDVDAYFYRTAGGAEVDLLLTWPGGEQWVVEVKRSAAPKLTQGFRSAWSDLDPAAGFVVHPGEGRYRIDSAIQVVGLAEMIDEVIAGGTRRATPPWPIRRGRRPGWWRGGRWRGCGVRRSGR